VYTFAPVKERFEHIIEQARSLFMRCGLRSVTMDDVSRELGISKKTLYQHVIDKPDLVRKTVEKEIESDQKAIEEILIKNLNAIDELIEISHLVAEKFKYLHPSIMYDMQKYYPDSWSLLENYRSRFIVKVILENILKGQKQGYFRTHFKPEVIARLYASKVQLITDIQLFPTSEFDQADVYKESLNYHIHGISNEKGINYLTKKINKTQH